MYSKTPVLVPVTFEMESSSVPIFASKLEQIITTLVKNAFVAFLGILFCFSVYNSYTKVLEEPTAIEESIDFNRATLPSVTFCSRSYDNTLGQKSSIYPKIHI